jgi:two-component system cell cycle response regulator DivK
MQALDEFSPDMILLDLRMPKMNGWQLAQQLSADPRSRRAKLVAVSACAFPADKERARRAGVSAYFTKPVVTQDLLRFVRQHFEQPQA